MLSTVGAYYLFDHFKGCLSNGKRRHQIWSQRCFLRWERITFLTISGGVFSKSVHLIKTTIAASITMKIDPYKHKEKYLNWKERVKNGIPGISKPNSEIILQYVSDMENGLNISSKSVKGARSYVRLNNIKQRMVFLAKRFEQYSNADLEELTEQGIFALFNGMRNGTIRGLTERSIKPLRIL